MKRNLTTITASIVFIAVWFISVGYQRDSTMNEDQQSLAVIAEINRCRTNPANYAETALKRHLDRFLNDNIYRDTNGDRIQTMEGRQRVLAAINELKNMQPVEPLVYDEDLTKAARFHCYDIGPTDILSHNSSDGTSMGDRLRRFVKSPRALGENIDYGNSTAEDIIVSLVIDDGVPSRGHLKNNMNPTYRHAGAAIGKHKQYGFMCTIDFSN